MSVLVIAEHDNQSLNAATLNTVAAADKLPCPIQLLDAGKDAQAVADEAAQVAGVEKAFLAEGDGLEHGLAENVAKQVLAIADAYQHILFPSTTFGKNVAPRVAALLDVAQVSDVTDVLAADTYTHPIYAGNALETVQCADEKVVLTIRTTAYDAVDTSGGSGEVESMDAVQDGGLSRFVGREFARSDRPDLAAAEVFISGGRCLGSGENFKLIDDLAAKLGAAVGASRAAVDAGYAPNDWQVGQTGKIVAPQLYIAVGISGAIQHFSGMVNFKIIDRIKKDPVYQI